MTFWDVFISLVVGLTMLTISLGGSYWLLTSTAPAWLKFIGSIGLISLLWGPTGRDRGGRGA